MKKKFTKEEIEKQIRCVRNELEENKDQLILAEIEGCYILLEEVSKLLKEKIQLLKEPVITDPNQP